VSELDAYIHGADLIVTTTVLGKKSDVPVINGLPFITGIGEEEVLKQIAEELKK
jgi:PTS system galactitol-specific IIB component